MFDKLLLISCICVVVALILYFFYWNRFIAFVFGQVIRLVFWNQEASSAWVEIGSIHFSLLAGRILLKDVRYHSSNQTVKIVKGQIQWRYWIRRPTTEEEFQSLRGEEGKQSSRLWSCRIQLSFQGVEWFLYNRTAAYDNIISQMERATHAPSRTSSHRRFFDRFARHDASSQFYPPSNQRSAFKIPSFVSNGLTWLNNQLPNLDPKDLLPLGIDVQTGAIILGNSSTPSLLVAEFQNAFGTYGIVPSRSALDLYKQVMNLRFQSALIRLVENDDFVDPMAIVGGLVHSRVKVHAAQRRPSFYQPYRAFIRIWRQLGLSRLTLDYFATRKAQRHAQKSISSALPGFKKSKPVEDETPIGIDFSTHEYVLERKILEAPALDLTYYVDVVGDVPSEYVAPFLNNATYDVGNGDTGPEWGFDMIIHGGILRYGPWADRQRTELQRAFFPPSYQDNEVTPVLKPGDKRLWTALKVFVELREETSIHIPFREASKDWQWDGQAEVPRRPKRREPGFFNLVVGDRSSISYTLPMIIGPTGYESNLEVHLDTVSITSSLNDVRLISAESTRIYGELPAPLKWDGERIWTIGVVLRQPTLYLLRDHINMFTDLGRDWVSGPPTDYYKFIPTIYAIQFEMHHYRMVLFVNDHNIIDKPSVREENALLTLKGTHFKTVATISSNTFRPESTSIPFTISAPNALGTFSVPRWSAHAPHIQKESIDLFKTKGFTINASYRYFAEVREEYVEQLHMDLALSDTVLRAFGWAIRYFMVLKDNYFGSFTHFQTLSEYLDKRKNNLPVGDPLKLKYRPGKSNMLQVTILLRAERASILLPTHLIGTSSYRLDDAETLSNAVTLSVPEIQLQLRLHDYYMEMSLNIDRILGSVKQDSIGHVSPDVSHEVLCIEGLDIVANRLFGSQPRTATYVCIWEIAVGDVKASLSANQAKVLSAAGDSFPLNFVDLANAPAEDFTPLLDPDVTFYKVSVKSVDLSWKAGHTALILQIPSGIKLDRNDLGAHNYKSVTSLRVPQISVKILLTGPLDRKTWLEAAHVDTEVNLDIYAAPCGHRALTKAQIAFVEEQDRATGRAKRLFDKLRHRSRSTSGSGHVLYRRNVYLPQPTLPRRGRNRSKGPLVEQIRSSRSRTRPPSWHIPTLANLSDSDEEVISEADRDARLARTRTSTPVPNPMDDNFMSSGDESDDADLTEGYTSDDDWSDLDPDSEGQSTGMLMSFYSPLLRHYVSNPRITPGLWDSESFDLIRDGPSFLRSNLRQQEDEHKFDQLPIVEDVTRDDDTTTLRLAFRFLNIGLTPLVLPALLYCEHDLKTVVPNPEICISSFLSGAISKATSKNRPKSSVVHLSISQVLVQALQHISMGEGGRPDVTKATKSSNIPSNLDIAGILRLQASNVRIAGRLNQKYPNLSTSVSRLIVGLDTSVDKRSINSAQSQSNILRVSCRSPSFQIYRNSLNANLGQVSVDVGHSSPEAVAAAAFGLSFVATRVVESMQRVTAATLATKRTLLSSVLKSSEQNPAIDPLSTIQPSFLVQSGVPQRLRSDVSFRFLFHLLHCVRSTASQEPMELGPDVDLEDLTAMIEERLSQLDPDAGQIDCLDSMDSDFLQHPSAKIGTVPGRSLDGATLYLPSARLAISDPKGGPESELCIEDLRIDLQFKKQDLVQFNFSHPSGASQTSLRARSSKIVRKTGIIVSVGNVAVIISPHLMQFAQHILRVKKQVIQGLDGSRPRKKTALDVLERTSAIPSGIMQIEVVAAIHALRIQAAAENLIVVIGLAGLRIATTLLQMQNKSLSINTSVLFDTIYLQARSPTDPSKESDHDILAALSFNGGRANLVSKPDARSRINLKLVFALSGISLNMPRSALRLYRFVEEWRQDYLPGMEAMVNDLLYEYKSTPPQPRSPTPSNQHRPAPLLQIHSRIDNFDISLQVMHGTWLSLETQNAIAYVHNSGPLAANHNHGFGLQINSTILNISSKPMARDVAPSSRVKLELPQLSIAGHSEGLKLHMLILLEFIDLKVKPSHWDTLLAVQQKFGQDFNDFLALAEKTRRKTPSPKPPAPLKTRFHYDAHIKMQGFRIGLVGLSSVVFLECQNINGGFASANGWTWDLALSDLALSLAPRVSDRRSIAFNMNQRSAFIIIDIKLGGSYTEGQQTKSVHMSIPKVHAVMQPSSIGEFGDFIDSLQVELLERQEQRALELEAFKEKAQNILKTFDVNVRDVQIEQASWLDDLNISVSIRSIGVAFPLTHDEELQLPRKRKNKEAIAVRAFLFSIKSIEFSTSRGETGDATMDCLSFQFVPRFRQSSPGDFSMERHHTRNCLLYPEMRAQLRVSSVGSSRKIWIKADVSGFILDIDSSIPSYIFALIDVYREGKERVDRLSAIAPGTPLSAVPPMPTLESVNSSTEKHYPAVPTSNVFAKLTFLSGKVRFYSASASEEFISRTPFTQTFTDIPDDQVLDLGAEVFNLPVVSVWAEYRATPASQKLSKGQDSEPSLLMFNSTIFSSQNTLRPTLLPFLTELVTHIEARMRKVSTRGYPPFPIETSSSQTSIPISQRVERSDSVSSMQICFSLRIDKSKLELTCQPDVNVVAGLHWESGGFIVNVSPGARKVFFSGSVGGLTIGLKHGFLSEDCVKLDARNLAFSVSFTRPESDFDHPLNSISIVLDTEFLGGVRFSRLQDILCFKAVWLDRIPVLNSQEPSEPKTPLLRPSGPEPVSQSRGFSTSLLFRIRRISLDVDLGQSISRVKLDLVQTVFRSVLSDEISEVHLHVADVSVTANGNISGRARVPACVFQTIRRSEGFLREDEGKSRMLEIRLTSGALIADFESDLQKLLYYRAEPLKVEICDDWSRTRVSRADARPLQLSFTITCPEIVVVATVGTIPKLLSYTNKFKANLDVQRQGAFRESQTFRVTRTPKPENPLSAVAEAMLHSARSRFKDAGVSFIVRQHMSLRLDLLRLIVFPRTMRDLEIAQFIGHDVRARMDGLVISDSPSSERDLHLSFASMVISKYNQSRPIPYPVDPQEDDGREWLSALFKDASESNIVGLPSMKMHMISEEKIEDSERVLIYDFFSRFVRREGMKAFEDIYITLNMSLYAWLTLLRKNLSREMDQVRATEDWRTSINGAATTMSPTNQRKKRVPEPLPLDDQPPRANSLPASANGLLSPLGPSSSRFVEGIKTPHSAREKENTLSPTAFQVSPLQFPSPRDDEPLISQPLPPRKALIYRPRTREIERLTMRQLGEATPDVMHPFFMKKAGFSLEDSLPQYVHEYATAPLEEILDILLKLYSRQLLAGAQRARSRDSSPY
ncbi:hypothetical protein CPB83DRAFT_789894 [Crepidotus variabilis]|uniref:Csf1 N-terminal domain-containing protein n=1 Tax=Crepidotus variabilis TaxID=179855 RepID=A0A9P6EI76_9AGAR|nr:hypothetical protein CPB83DRAFT_789894 [Crepidotus variabilis]